MRRGLVRDVLVHLLGFVPVLLFLGALRFMDSYKLVRGRALLVSLVAGALAAFACIPLYGAAIDALPWSETIAKRYVAPLIEECAKAAFVAYLIRAGKTGFIVDAAIHGFAVGAGFALIENAVYAVTLRDASVGLWLVRGLGTAVMHGSTTAIVGILTKDQHDRRTSLKLLGLIPGLAIAFALHSWFNHFALPPIVMTGLLVLVMPLLLTAVFERSERSTHAWLTSGFDSEFDQLETLLGSDLGKSRIGLYLKSLREWFSGPVLADMLCYLRLHFELSLRAKGLLMARAEGIEVPPDPRVPSKFGELRYLEAAIGRTGKLAILPFIRASGRGAWQLELLRKHVPPGTDPGPRDPARRPDPGMAGRPPVE